MLINWLHISSLLCQWQSGGVNIVGRYLNVIIKQIVYESLIKYITLKSVLVADL